MTIIAHAKDKYSHLWTVSFHKSWQHIKYDKCSIFLLKGEYVICNIIGKGSKCSRKPEFNVSMVLLPCLVCLHHWREPCNLHNLKCHSSLNCPCMKGCYCCHKGMDIGISYVVIPVCVCKKFFQAFLQKSSVHHPVVQSESLLHHQSCQSIQECCLDLGCYQSWRIGICTLV